ncbi:MAG: sporulation protein [Firmicutes bacterium]|nr:sporulation protein [Bacillota bacterium]
MSFDNGFWGSVEKKTKVSKDTIISLAKKLQNGNMKDEQTLNEVIDTLSSITGKKVSDEKRKKIIDKVVSDKVPKNIDKMF